MANASLHGCTGSVRETMDDSRKAWRINQTQFGLDIVKSLEPHCGGRWGSGRTTGTSGKRGGLKKRNGIKNPRCGGFEASGAVRYL